MICSSSNEARGPAVTLGPNASKGVKELYQTTQGPPTPPPEWCWCKWQGCRCDSCRLRWAFNKTDTLRPVLEAYPHLFLRLRKPEASKEEFLDTLRQLVASLRRAFGPTEYLGVLHLRPGLHLQCFLRTTA